MKRFILSALLFLLSAGVAAAITIQLNIVISSPPATSVTFAATAPCTFVSTPSPTINCTEPIAAGTQIGTLTVAPSNWAGVLSMTGTTVLVINGTAPNYTINVGSAAITSPTSITMTFTTTP